MFPVRHDVTLTTAADGSATAYTTDPVCGRVLQVRLVAGTLDAGAALTITGETTGVAILAATPGASATYAPRQATHAADGTASLYAAAGEPVEECVVIKDERIKTVVASGGATKTGTLYIWTG